MIYKVEWEIEIDADTPEEAARIADRWLMEGSPEGWVFTVTAPDGTKQDIDTGGLNISDEE